MEEDGEEKLIAAVRHIAKSLGRTETMADDILQVFSAFDNRFSLDKLSDKPHPPPPATDDDDHSAQRGPDGHGHHHKPTLVSTERTIRSLDRQISRFVSSGRMIWADSADAAAFLEAVDDLLATIHDLDSPAPAPSSKLLLDRADDLLQRSMLRLEEEFRAIIERPDGSGVAPPPAHPSQHSDDSDGDDTADDRIPVAHPVESYDLIIDALPPGSVADLHEIASRMVAAGFGRECAETYSSSRQDFVEESVARLGLRPRTADEVHAAAWPDLEAEIPRWIKAVKMVFLILIPSERRLCDRVFASLPHFADFAFAAACRSAALSLLSFASAIAAGSRAPERLFVVIDMYEAIRDLMPELDVVLADQYSAPLRSDIGTVYKALGQAIRGIFMELENLIRRDPAKTAVPGGDLHPITRYVLNYLRAACASRRTLEEVMEEDAGTAVSADTNRPSSSLSVQIAWIMDVLQANLDAKSKIYREPSLSCIFLMNNGRYIIQKVKDSELEVLLGEEWLRRQMSFIRRWGSDYQRTTWTKVVAVLRMDGVGGPASLSVAAGKAMRERLRMFNAYLDETWRVQGAWVVADEQLRSELRVAIQELVLPAYRNFVGRLRQTVEAGNLAERYLKYTVEEVEAKINELFEGSRRRA